MSRAYRIQVKESLRRHVQVEDGISSKLELLPILPRERMGALLGAELEKRGYQREGDAASRTLADGVKVSVDLLTGEVSARVSEKGDVEVTAQRTRNVNREPQLGSVSDEELALRAQVQRDLEAKADRAEDKLRQGATAKLDAAVRELRGELDAVVNRVTAEALKSRAGELGTIEEISEDPATGSMTIKVRV